MDYFYRAEGNTLIVRKPGLNADVEGFTEDETFLKAMRHGLKVCFGRKYRQTNPCGVKITADALDWCICDDGGDDFIPLNGFDRVDDNIIDPAVRQDHEYRFALKMGEAFDAGLC